MFVELKAGLLNRSLMSVKHILRTVVIAFFSLSTSTAIADKAVEAQVQSILQDMTLEQKVGQMIQGEIKWVTPEDVTKYHLGSVLNGGGSFPNQNKGSSADDWLQLADSYYHASLDRGGGGAGIPLVWGTDAVHGHNNVIGATLFPHNIGLGVANDPALMREIGEITAREVAVTGIDWVFAPTVAVVKDYRWGRTYEGYSSESPIVRSYAGEIVKGMQGEPGELRTNSERVIGTAKHFIGDGATYRGIDQGEVTMDLEQLLEEHGQGYYKALDAGVQTVMASFNSWNGLKLHGHKQLLTDVLKGSMGFDGFVVSDWNGIGQVDGCNNESCAQSVNAGVDMIMAPEDWKALLFNTIAQVKSGEIAMSRIDDAVTRILRVKIRAGLYEKGAPSTRKVAGKTALIGAPEHRAVAREAVRKSLILLKNKNQILPLKPNQHVLVTGDGADNIGKQNGGWTITWQGTENKNSEFPGATSIYAGLESGLKNIGSTSELSVDGSWAEKPDVAVVVFGEEPYAEGVGDIESLVFNDGDKTDLKLLQSLKKQNIPVVAVFLTGRPLWMNAEINSSDAFVVAWLPGTEGGGIADVLIADAEGQPRYDFTGKLSFDWPFAEQNKTDKSQPVADLLFTLGQGLAYGDKELIAGKLNEVSMTEGLSVAQIVFNGSNRAPFKAFIGDSSDWSRLVEGSKTKSAFGDLTVTTVDGTLQEDSRLVKWTGKRESQFFWQSEDALSLSDMSDKNGAVMVEFRVDKRPRGKVTQRMDCGWPCHGAQDVTKMFRRAPKGEWVTRGISLKCFKAVGADLEKVTTPFLLATSRSFAVTIKDVRVVPNAPADLIEYCDLEA
ncbi:MAG: glycoside hydrolase family 3 N-terminal domain-containing protein [Porticoccaceae bacterium]|nr:glycoside hydrolase family 3 N-terminal domain-containing protein [Porticoccaceae bacterium]